MQPGRRGDGSWARGELAGEVAQREARKMAGPTLRTKGVEI